MIKTRFDYLIKLPPIHIVYALYMILDEEWGNGTHNNLTYILCPFALICHLRNDNEKD